MAVLGSTYKNKPLNRELKMKTTGGYSRAIIEGGFLLSVQFP
jgi:hypothetical protein